MELNSCFRIFPKSFGIPIVLIDITGTINRGLNGVGGLIFLLISIIRVIRVIRSSI